jgi:L-cysteine:1D-myo-inositol 2-amino-2-deoxy-alpha-D-glucopyranoside ligase
VGELLKEWEPAAIRLALLSHHYRPDWEWRDEDLATAADRLARWRASGVAARADQARAGVGERLDDDLDTPGALAWLDRCADEGLDVGPAAQLLGITL